jgi:hypothetical protein
MRRRPRRAPGRTRKNPEEPGRRRGDAELTPVDAVLNHDYQHLRDHSETRGRSWRGRCPLRRATAHPRQRCQHRQGARHQREARDREPRVAPGARDRRPDRVVEIVTPAIVGASSSPASVGLALVATCTNSGTNTVTANSAAGRGTARRSRSPRGGCAAARTGRSGRPLLARRERDGEQHGPADQAEDLGRAPAVAVAAPDAHEHQGAGGRREQSRAGQVERPLGAFGVAGGEGPCQSCQRRYSHRQVHVGGDRNRARARRQQTPLAIRTTAFVVPTGRMQTLGLRRKDASAASGVRITRSSSSPRPGLQQWDAGSGRCLSSSPRWPRGQRRPVGRWARC